MGKKIDLTSTESAQLTDNTSPEVLAGTKKNDFSYLKSLGVRALPADPSAAGWNDESVKKQFYKQPEILFAWLKRLATSQLTLGKTIDEYLNSVAIGKETPKVFSSKELADDSFANGYIKTGSLVFVNGIDDISCYYASTTLVKVGQSIKETLARFSSIENDVSLLDQNKQDNLVSGTNFPFINGVNILSLDHFNTAATQVDETINSLSKNPPENRAVFSFVDAYKQGIASGTIKPKLSQASETDSSSNKFETTYETINNVKIQKERIDELESGAMASGKALYDINGKDLTTEYVHSSSLTADSAETDKTKVPKLSLVETLIANAVSALVNGSPAALDTLKELSNALGGDENFATTVADSIGLKLSKTEASDTYLSKADAATSYDAKGSASAVQGNTTETVKTVKDNLTTLDSNVVKTINGATPSNNNINIGGIFVAKVVGSGLNTVIRFYFSSGAIGLAPNGQDIRFTY